MMKHLPIEFCLETAVQSLILKSYSAAIARSLCPSCKLAWQKPGTEKIQFKVHSR